MQARVRAFAKLNLSLEVLNRRPDGFHNIRTIFQTISLHDTVLMETRRAAATSIRIESKVEIPGENLIARAANSVLELTGVRTEISFTLRKRIPMGGGLGGGSADAAAVLIALPRLLKKPVDPERLLEAASALGSDVPFFLMGGAAVGLGRGTELYPLPDPPKSYGILLTPGVHVSTADAYRALNRTDQSTCGDTGPTTNLAMALGTGQGWSQFCMNDFETAVFAMHPELASLKDDLAQLGARPAMMTGSGSAIFGLYSTKEKRNSALRRLGHRNAAPFSFVSRRRYLSRVARS